MEEFQRSCPIFTFIFFSSTRSTRTACRPDLNMCYADFRHVAAKSEQENLEFACSVNKIMRNRKTMHFNKHIKRKHKILVVKPQARCGRLYY